MTTPPNKATPETDAAMFYQPSDRHSDEVVPASFARSLEQRLNEAVAERDQLKSELVTLRKMAEEVGK